MKTHTILALLTTLSLVEASDPPRPLKADTGRMISILKGKSADKPATAPVPREISRKITPKAAAPAPILTAPVTVRRAKITPEAAPKGYAMSQAKSAVAPQVPVKSSASAASSPSGGAGIDPRSPRFPSEDRDVAPRGRPSNPKITDGGFPADLPGYPGGHSAAKPRPQKKPVPAEISYQVDSSSRLSTDTVKFIKGGVELADKASYDYLFSLAEALRSEELKGERFVVEGHASAEGSDFANQVLSQRRANAIFDFLASRGVQTDRLLAVGHGESQARFADSDPEFLRAQDRQVVVFKLAE